MTEYTPNSTPTKYCPRCKTTKPTTPEFWGLSKQTKDGFQGHCKACRRNFRQENIEQVRESNRIYRAENTEKIRQRRAARKEKERETYKRYYSENKDKLKEKNRRWREKNKEKRSEYERRYTAEHKEQKRLYRAANGPMNAANRRRRTARQRAAEGNHTADDVKRQYKAQKGRCYYCGCKVGSSYHVDHVIPLSRGGSNGPENIVVACSSCNLSKANKMPHEWPAGGRLL